MNEGIYEATLENLGRLGIRDGISPARYTDLLRLRAALMCVGVGPSDLTQELAAIVNPSGEKRTGNVGLPVTMRTPFGKDFLFSLPTSVVYKGQQRGDRDFTASSPFGLEGSVDDLVLTLEGRPLVSLELYAQPEWIRRMTSSGKPMTAMFLPEAGDNLMGALRMDGGCEYFMRKEACGFCGLDPIKGGDGKTVEDYAEVALAAFTERPTTTSLTLTAGNTYDALRGLQQYLGVVSRINELVRAAGITPSIEVEASPPDFATAARLGEATINALLDAGVTSFISNMEQYTPSARASALPAKSRIPNSDYAAFFGYLRERGVPASSVLIVGMDDTDEGIVEGAQFLLDKGAYPIILPFRPRGKFGNRSPIDPTRLYDVSRQVGKLTAEYGIRMSAPGCASCGGCSIDMQATNLAYKEMTDRVK